MPQPVAKPKIVKGDTVQLRRGKEKGKRGVVSSVHPKDGTAMVTGLNVVKRHSKPNTAGAQQGGILEKEKPIPLSVLMVVEGDKPTRVRRVRKDDGTVARVAVRTGEELIAPQKGR